MRRTITFFFCFTLSLFIHAGSLPFKLGLENVSKQTIEQVCVGLMPCRIGLITNQTGRDQQGRRNVELLRDAGFNIVMLLAPEHGIDGKTLAGEVVGDTVDVATGIPVASLYGHGTGKRVSLEVLKQVDVLMFDIQDSGMRHYTYISTLLNAMKAAAEHDKCFVVLDRPNPLGAKREGPLVEPGLISFISIAPIPLRHGMTVGELAHYFNNHMLDKPASLQVVPMASYQRRVDPQQELLAPLSPNIASQRSCHGYSFLGLLGELDGVDVGVGTNLAFQVLALPKERGMDDEQWLRLAALMENYAVMTDQIEYFSPHKKRACRGLRIHIADINTLQAFPLFLDVLDFLHEQRSGIQFSPYFDKAVGTSRIRTCLAEGDRVKCHRLLCADLEKDHDLFMKKVRSSLLYEVSHIS